MRGMFCNQPLSAYTARSTQAREPLSVDAFNGRSRAWLELDTNANWVTGKMVHAQIEAAAKRVGRRQGGVGNAAGFN